MSNKLILMWLRRHGMLCRKYKYAVPSKPRVSKTIYPTPDGKQFSSNGQEWYGIIGKNEIKANQ